MGPTPELLELFGNKVRARVVAIEAGSPVLAGSERAVTLDEAREVMASLRRGRGDDD